MSSKQPRTAPVATTSMPGGIPFIIGNETAERFSYYGMKSILTVFMTQYLVNSAGEPDVMSGADATGWYHVFGQAVYFLPVFGAILADGLLGKYKTILWLSVVYCLGHAVLAFDETRMGLALGLGLIAMGSGGIKPCVSAHVGDQFGKSNAHLMSRVFSWFYFAINFGSFFATLLIPYLLNTYGPHVAFGLPGVLMFIATVAFWLGRDRYVHIPPGGKQFVKETFSPTGLKAIAKLVVLMAFLAPYYSLFEQMGSSWIIQAKKLDLNFFGVTLLPSQMHSLNPIFVMILAPFFAYVLYPFVGRFTKVTALRKIGVGFFVTAFSFVICAFVESKLQQGEATSGWWQVLSYLVLTVGEVLVSITALEFFYTQAPTKMKSAIMAIKMFAVSVGNGFTALINFVFVGDGQNQLSGPTYFLFFAGLLAGTSVIYVFAARYYKVESYIQEEAT